MKDKRSVKRIWRMAAALCLTVIMTVGNVLGGIAWAAERPYYLSATYCSDEWVITFWNSESANMEAELAQIAQDGFNSIILVVPWREFQPSMSPVRYEEYAFEKLHQVMATAERYGLDVLFRVGYTWDYSKPEGQDGNLERYRRLLYDDSVKAAWMDYVRTLYAEASVHGNFAGGFLTWEDFWNFVESAGSYGTGKNSREWAQKIGYSRYITERYDMDEINRLYGTEFSSQEEIYLPSRQSPAFKLFFEFYDHFLMNILLESQQIFPNLSMEVRLDVDPVQSVDGETVGCSHQPTFDCGNSTFASAMYSVSMGSERNGRIYAGDAIQVMDEILGLTQLFNGRKPIYIDQLLFMDNTPGFEENARLIESEIPAFVMNCSDVLRRRSKGYGIWTYRDYCDNILYNAQFGLEKSGWNFEGQARVEEMDGNKRAVLPARSAVTQEFRSRLAVKKNMPVHVQFLAAGEAGSSMTVTLGSRSQTVSLTEEATVYNLEFDPTDYQSVSFRSGKDAWVDDVKVYTFVTKSEVYHFDGTPGIARDAVRELNRRMQ